jgi:glycolate oxidase FAD binding subunit
VAANSAGPGRYHYGGLRDFLIGVRFVDCAGQLVRGGGKVVKNSAGFDLPKLMVGGLGSFGALYELTFKVFPRPEAYATLVYETGSLEQAAQLIGMASSSKVDLDAVDFMPGEHGVILWIRLAGLAAALPARLERLQGVLGNSTVLSGEEEGHFWSQASEMAWVPQGWSLIKVPITPGQALPLESAQAASHPTLLRRYSAGGQVAWLATPESPVALDSTLKGLGLHGLVLLGEVGEDGPRLGLRDGESFYRRVKQALDPASRFVEA